jgi:hypothetical protein
VIDIKLIEFTLFTYCYTAINIVEKGKDFKLKNFWNQVAYSFVTSLEYGLSIFSNLFMLMLLEYGIKFVLQYNYVSVRIKTFWCK